MRFERWSSPLLLVLFTAACGEEINSTTSTGSGGGGTGGTAGTGGTGGTGTTGETGGTGTTGATGGGGTGGTGATGATGGGGTGATGGGGTGGSGGDCTWAKDDPCGPGQYCKAANCGAGTCVPIGTLEEADRVPTCGCDGVTYWNATVAASHGMSVAANGECAIGTQAQCGGFAGLQCPDGASCNNKIPDKNSCNIADLGGTCWGVPKNCDGGIGFGPNTRACGAANCANECNLIKGEAPWYVDNTCPQ